MHEPAAPYDSPLIGESPSVLRAEQPIATVSQDVIDRLKQMALAVSLKRARLCLHASRDDAVQEMVIALHCSTYIRPHRHPNKCESFHMIEGAVRICFFDDTGEIFRTLDLRTDTKDLFLYRMSASYWHTVQPLTEFAIFHEVARGPFSQAEFPIWGPKDDPQSIEEFKNRVARAGR